MILAAAAFCDVLKWLAGERPRTITASLYLLGCKLTLINVQACCINLCAIKALFWGLYYSVVPLTLRNIHHATISCPLFLSVKRLALCRDSSPSATFRKYTKLQCWHFLMSVCQIMTLQGKAANNFYYFLSEVIDCLMYPYWSKQLVSAHLFMAWDLINNTRALFAL